MYNKSKIYKLQCDDGYFYIGSTRDELRKRFQSHKDTSTREHKNNTKVYSHINEIGWNRVRIILVEDYPCENRTQLRQREDYYIRQYQSDPFCLNMIGAVVDKEHHKELVDTYYQTHKEQLKMKALKQYEKNKEKRREQAKEYYHKTKESKREEKNKRERERYTQKKSIINNLHNLINVVVGNEEGVERVEEADHQTCVPTS